MKDYNDVIKRYGYSENFPIETVYQDLEEKYQIALDKFDVAQSKGDEKKIAERDKEIVELEKALEIVGEIRSGFIIDSADNKTEKLKGYSQDSNMQYQLQYSTMTMPQNIPAQSVVSDEISRKIKNLLNRGKQDLEDKNWEEAKLHFDEVLDLDAENASAYYGMWMAKFELNIKEIPVQCIAIKKDKGTNPFDDYTYKRVLKYGDPDLLSQMESYRNGYQYLLAVEAKEKAETDEDYIYAGKLFEDLGDFADAKDKVQQVRIENLNRKYKLAKDMMDTVRTAEDYTRIIELFQEIEGFEDSEELLEKCKLLKAERSKIEYQKNDYQEELRTFDSILYKDTQVQNSMSMIEKNIKRKKELDSKSKDEFIPFCWTVLVFILELYIINMERITGWMSGFSVPLTIAFMFIGFLISIVIAICVGSHYESAAAGWSYFFLFDYIYLSLFPDSNLSSFGTFSIKQLHPYLAYIGILLFIKNIMHILIINNRMSKINDCVYKCNREIDNIVEIAENKYNSIYEKYSDLREERTSVSTFKNNVSARIKKKYDL